jgi:hypothetical protein
MTYTLFLSLFMILFVAFCASAKMPECDGDIPGTDTSGLRTYANVKPHKHGQMGKPFKSPPKGAPLASHRNCGGAVTGTKKQPKRHTDIFLLIFLFLSLPLSCFFSDILMDGDICRRTATIVHPTHASATIRFPNCAFT